MAHLQGAAVKQITEIVNRYKGEGTPLMMILSDIQKEYGYIPLEVQELVSLLTGIPVSEIYGVVTFYSFFSLTPKGKYVVGVCLGTACYVKGSQLVLDKFEELLGIKPGETTPDGLFTLDALRCVGACAIAPAVSINGKVHPMVQVSHVEKIISDIRRKEEDIVVCGGTGCLSSDSREILERFHHLIKEHHLEDKVTANIVGCFGFCSQGPFVKVFPEDTLYTKVKVEDCEEIIEKDIMDGKVVERLLFVDPQSHAKVAKQHEIPFYKLQKRDIALKGNAEINP